MVEMGSDFFPPSFSPGEGVKYLPIMKRFGFWRHLGKFSAGKGDFFL